MFIGEYDHHLDGKNRLSIPVRFREAVESAEERKGFFVTRGLDSCLFLYTESQWNEVIAGLKAKPFTDAVVRKFQRAFFSNATYAEFDNQGRILIPENLKRFAGLVKNVTVIGVLGRIEVWDRDAWRAAKHLPGGEYESLAQQLF